MKNRIITLTFRIILFGLVVYNVYLETGLFTAIALVIVYGGDEYYSFTHHRLIKKIDELKAHIDHILKHQSDSYEKLKSEWRMIEDIIRKHAGLKK
jgi:hypothetical protein